MSKSKETTEGQKDGEEFTSKPGKREHVEH